MMFHSMLRHVFRRYDVINGPLLAKGLGFSLILGLLPLIFIAITVVAYFASATPELQDSIVTALSGFIPADVLDKYVSQVFRYSVQWRSFSVITLVFFLLFALNLFNAMGRVLRTILSRKKVTASRNNLISLVLLIISLLLMYLTLVTGNNFQLLHRIFPFGGEIGLVISTLIDVVLVAIALLALFYIYSNRMIDPVPTMVTAFIGATIWKSVGMLGTLIIRSMSNRIIIFGAMATPIMLMMYLRIFGEILIFSSLIVDYYASRMQNFLPDFSHRHPHEHGEIGCVDGDDSDSPSKDVYDATLDVQEEPEDH